MNGDGISVEMSATLGKASNVNNNNRDNNSDDNDDILGTRQIDSQDESQNESSLNRPRNAHERIYAKDVNLDDYEDIEDT